MSRLLVCPPDYFCIDYEINPWMRVSNAAHPERARAQWHGLMRVLEQDIGVLLERMQPVAGLPDMVFTANAGSVIGRRAVPSRFRHPERRREERYFEQWFRDHQYDVVLLDESIPFEGAGDLLGFPDIRFGGYRQRTDVRAYARLSEIFACEIIPLELIDPRFYHLDTCFCPLSGGELLYYPPAFDAYAQAVIRDRIGPSRRIVVPQADALRFACNAVCVGKHVVLPDGCPDTMHALAAQGYDPHPVPLDEFMKAGGSAKCLTLTLD
ncbi:MAG TPA: arginine deiminase-related protein [Nitrospiraceae bacterium]|nr:arginine deiminase-related protein [Nitrospiraceae bacterium]